MRKLLSLVLLLLSPLASAENRPNILLLMAEDMSARAAFPWEDAPDDVPFYGFMTFMETHENGLSDGIGCIRHAQMIF